MTGPLYDHLRGRHDWNGRATVEGLQAVKYLQAQGREAPALLAYWPAARVNPFQALLYAALWEHGVAPVSCMSLDDIDEVRELATRTGTPAVLHLHWLGGMLDGAATEDAAEAALARELARLDAWRAAGGSLVWSVHNVLPHDSRFEKWDAALRQGVADRADVVHVLAADTAAEVAEWFTLPADRTVHIGHPNYVGAYPDVVRRDEARWSLGLQPDDRVYAMLGAIKPYKGFDHLLAAFDEVAAADPMRHTLVVAGAADDDPDTAAFLERCDMHPRVLLRPSRVPEGEMQYYLHAADLVVMPYQRSLNSGVLMLALSFGVPVVAPDVAGVREVVDTSAARLFAPGDLGGLVAALRDAEALCTPEARAAAAALAARHDPREIAERFARTVVDRALPPR